MTEQPATVETTLAQYVKAAAKDQPFVDECAARAKALVAARVRSNSVPGPILSLAELEVGADLFWRRSARNGVAGFDGPEAGPTPVRIRRDPMAAAEELLRPYLGPAIA